MKMIYIIVSYDYFGDVSTDSRVYLKKEEAEKIAIDGKKQFPTLNFNVMSVGNLIVEMSNK